MLLSLTLSFNLAPRSAWEIAMGAPVQMLTKPGHCCIARRRKLPKVRIEMPALDGHELLGFQRLLISTQPEIGQGDVIGQGYDHQQRGGRNTGNPVSRLIHPGE